MSSTECTTILMNCMHATINSIWKDSGLAKNVMRVSNLRDSPISRCKKNETVKIKKKFQFLDVTY